MFIGVKVRQIKGRWSKGIHWLDASFKIFDQTPILFPGDPCNEIERLFISECIGELHHRYLTLSAHDNVNVGLSQRRIGTERRMPSAEDHTHIGGVTFDERS